MATHTDYFNLEKPESYENYNIEVFNDNADTIDLQMHNNQVSAAKVMVGATSLADGESGRVPTPHAGDEDKFLKGDGTWGAVTANVEANPSGTPTDTLETIRINNVIYQLPEGGDTEITGDAEGSIIAIDDGKLNAPLKACTVDINPVQSGSGTPSPSNIRPISGWTKVNIGVVKHNILNKSGTNTNNGYVNNAYLTDDGSIASYNNFYVTEYVKLKPSTTYRVSGVQGDAPNLCLYDANKNYIQSRKYQGAGSFTITTTQNTRYIRLSCERGANEQVEEGTTAHAYEPYNGYSIDLNGTVYSGTLDVVSGVLTANKVMVELDSLTWSSWGSSNVNRYLANLPYNEKGSGDIHDFLCSCFNTSTTGSTNICWINAHRILVVGVDATTVSDFVEAISGQTIVYEIATPTEVSLTPTEITTLYGDNVIWADSGDMAITYVRDTSIAINDALNQSITPTYSSGTKIADYNVGGHTGAIYVQGAGGHMDTLWTGNIKPTSDSMPTVQLANPLSGYDYIVVEGYGAYDYYTTDAIYKPVIGRTYLGKLNDEINYCAVLTIINDSNVQLKYWGIAGSNTNIVAIYGVKI